MSATLYLVDTFSLMFQVFHAIRQPMTGSRGQPTNAVFGFTRDLLYLRDQKKPTHLVCAADSEGPGTRNELYADYKANRTEIPDDLRPQIPMVFDVIRGFRIPVVECPGWEADDVIATLARQAAEAGMDVRIVTGDKDAFQLISPRVQIYSIRKDRFIDADALREQWGVRPDQVVDFQALVGDPVDNVPGVPLVGPKKAAALLQEFDTLDRVLAHADQAPGAKLRENLATYGERARLSRELVRLNDRLPLELDWETARVQHPDCERLLDLFNDFAFGRFVDEIRKLAQAGQPALKKPCGWEVVDTPEKFAAFLDVLRRQRTFCLDLETTGLDAMRADIVGWAFRWSGDGDARAPRETDGRNGKTGQGAESGPGEGSGYYLPVDGPADQARLDGPAVLEALRPILESPDVLVVNQNIKYDMLVLRRAGVRLSGVGVDPMVGDYLLDAGARSHGLDSLAERYLNHRMIPIGDLIGRGKVQKKMFEVDIAQAAEYAVEDADVAWQLAEVIGEKLRAAGLWDLYWELERPLIGVLAEMEYAGIRVDVEELRRQSADVGRRLEAMVAEIHELAGREFNIASPKQLAEVLFQELKLPAIRRTRTGLSTDQDVLEQLAPLHPLPAKIIAHRQLAKLKGTYLDALPAMVHPGTGRIHASFNQVVAATGRLSSSDPNLQNIPIRTEEGSRVRRAFVPGEAGWQLLCADYSQIELRMLAHFSGDEALVAAFHDGADIHTAVAAQVFGIPAPQVDAAQRRVAKAVNFGVIYGQSPYGLSAVLGIPKDEAARFIDGYFDRYAGVERFLHSVLEECRDGGYARTILGRRRAIEGIRSTTGRVRNMPERTAINTVIQGSAADLIKRAMIRVAERLKRERIPARMLLQIHDELVFEVPAGEVGAMAALVQEEMEQALDLRVPLAVDLKAGDNWLDAVPLANVG